MDSSKFPTPMLSMSSTESEDINQQLFKAVEEGKLREVKKLLKKGADPSKKGLFDGKRYTVLMVAVDNHRADNSRLDIIKALIRKKSITRIFMTGAQLNNALMLAAEKGLDDLVTLFVGAVATKPRSKPRLDAINNHGWSAFSLACINGHLSTMTILAKAGVFTQTPELINHVISKKSVDMVMSLVHDYQFDVDKFPDFLDISSVQCHKNDPFIMGMKLAIHAGDKTLLKMFMDLCDTPSREPLMQNACLEAVKKGLIDIVGLLSPYIIKSINSPIDSDGTTMACLAANLGHFGVLIELIRNGASVNNFARSFHMQNAFSHAALLRDQHLISILFYSTKFQEDRQKKQEYLNDALIEVLKLRDDLCALCLIKEGASLEYINEKGENAIILAGQYNCSATLEYCFKFVQKNHIIQKWKAIFELALLRATEHSATQSALYLIGKVDSECFDEHRNTPIMWASKNGLTHVVQELLKIEAFVNRYNALNQSAIMLAIESGHEVIAVLLLNAGSNALQLNKDEQTLLMCSAQKGFLYLTQILVQEYGLRIDQMCKQQRNALMYAGIAGHAPVVKYLISRGAKTELQDLNRKNVFMQAYEHKHAGVVGTLIREGVNFKLTDENYNIIFKISAQRSHDIVIHLLFESMTLKHYDPINQAFLYVVRNNISELIEPFLNIGADLHYVSDDGKSIPIFACMHHSNFDSFELLLKHGASTDAMMGSINLMYAAAQYGNFLMVKKLIEMNPNLVDLLSESGHPPVYVAAQGDHSEVVRLLLTEGKSNYLNRLVHDARLLHFSARYGSYKTIEVLLDLGVPVDVLDQDNATALIHVAKSSHEPRNEDNLVRAAEVLIKRGANIYLLSLMHGQREYLSALQTAFKYENFNVAKRIFCAYSFEKIQICLKKPEFQEPIQNIIEELMNAQNCMLAFLSGTPDPEIPSPFLSLPMELKLLILSQVEYSPWYQHRYEKDAAKSVQIINKILEDRKLTPPAVIFSNCNPNKRNAEKADLNINTDTKPDKKQKLSNSRANS